MKKIIPLVVLTLLSSITIAQNIYPQSQGLYFEQQNKSKPIKSPHQKSIIWTEDFGNGLNSTNGTWTQSGTDQIWKHSMYTTSGEWSVGTPAPATTTAANGIMLFDADSVNFLVSPNYVDRDGALISPSIDLSGVPGVILEFEHNARFCCSNSSGLFTVSVSNDGGSTWTDFNVLTGLAVNAGSANPEVEAINISSVAANQPNVQIRFNFGSSGNSHYYWLIDDICLATPSNDVEITGSYYSPYIEYTKYPITQTVPLTPCAIVNNNGGSSATNLVDNIEFVHQSLGVVSSTTSAPLATLPLIDTVCGQTAYEPTNLGAYTINHAVSINETEVSLLDNVISQTFDVTTNIYARDSSASPTSMWNGATGGISTSYELGNAFEFVNDDYIENVLIYVHPNTNVGTLVYGVVYKEDLSGFAYINQTNDYTVTAGDLGTWISLPIFTPVAVFSGELYVVCAGHYGGTNALYIGGAQPAPVQTSFLLNGADNTWYYVTTTPMVRIELGQGISAVSSGTSASCFGVCDGTATAIPSGGGPFNYLWDDASIQTTQTASGLCAGTYTCTITGGSGSTTTTSFTVSEPTALSIIMSSTGSTGSNGTATGIAAGGTSPYTYLWDDATAQTTQTATNLAPGTYYVVITDSSGCVNTDSITVYNITGLNDFSSLINNVIVAPNPSNGQFKVQFSKVTTEEIEIVVIDMLGKVVSETTIDQSTGDQTVILDSENWASGVYSLHFRQLNNSIGTIKLMKN